MSNNMIKGYAVSYEKEVFKKLDFKSRELDLLEQAKQLYRDQHNGEEAVLSEDGFVAGLEAEYIPDDYEESAGCLENTGENTIIGSDELEEYKEQLRESLAAELRTEIECTVREEMTAAYDEIISSATAEAERIKSKAIEEGTAAGEAAKAGIITLASSQGYEDGIKRAKEEQAHITASLEEEKSRLEKEYARQVEEMEPAFVEILKDYVRKITGISYENHTAVIVYLIDTAINKCPRETTFQVNLSPEDYDRLKPEFDNICDKYADKLAITFNSDTSLKSGDIQLENNGRILDCSLGIIMEGLLDALDMLSA